jgi:hypothetical protein
MSIIPLILLELSTDLAPADVDRGVAAVAF